MKHRDRILIALHHEEPDRCPMQISFTPEFASRLRLDLLKKERAAHNPSSRSLLVRSQCMPPFIS